MWNCFFTLEMKFNGVRHRVSWTPAHKSQLLNFKDTCRLVVKPLKSAIVGVLYHGNWQMLQIQSPNPSPYGWFTSTAIICIQMHSTTNSHKMCPPSNKVMKENITITPRSLPCITSASILPLESETCPDTSIYQKGAMLAMRKEERGRQFHVKDITWKTICK